MSIFGHEYLFKGQYIIVHLPFSRFSLKDLGVHGLCENL